MEPNEATIHVTPDITPLMEETMVHFRYAHLAPHLQEISKPFGELAKLVYDGPHNRRALMALDALLDAKNYAVQAMVHDTVRTERRHPK